MNVDSGCGKFLQDSYGNWYYITMTKCKLLGNMETHLSNFQSLLQSIILHWQGSAKAYKEYMENGKKFRYAELLKVHNTAVKDLLTKNIDLFPADLKKDAEAVIEHYTIWSAKWDELKNKMNPAPGDEFVFENDHRFPKAAAQRIEAALHL